MILLKVGVQMDPPIALPILLQLFLGSLIVLAWVSKHARIT